MNNWLNRLERKYGRYGIPNLTNILVAGQILVLAIELFVDRTVTVLAVTPVSRQPSTVPSIPDSRYTV